MDTNNVNNSLEGRASVEVELKLPNDKVIPFSKINVQHIQSSISESIKKSSTHELILQAPSIDYVDSLIRFAQSQGTPKLRYRVSLGAPGKTVSLPWQEHIITDLSAVLEGKGTTAGHLCRLTTRDSLFTISRQTKTISREGKISQIVAQIAKENGLTNTVIEDTVSEGMWIQSFVDDVDFIRSRLLHRASNSKGRGNYNFYIQDNALHFHSPDYQAALKDMEYYGAGSTNLTQLDDSQRMIEAGASGVRLITYDPYTAQMQEVSSDPTKALRFGNTMHRLDKVAGSGLNKPFHLSTNSLIEARNIAQSLYESSRSQTLGLKLEVMRSVFLRVGDVLRINIAPTGNKSTAWSGTYLVTDSSAVIDNGALITSFVVKRGEFQTNRMAPTSMSVLGESVVISDQEAPGQPLNLKAMQSSTIAHGSGQASSTSVYVETQSRNTAPSPAARY